MRQGFPRAEPGQRIGLLGGSFDPAHAGHLHISREALKRFGLTRVWWLVSPGNPLKARASHGLADRLAAARGMVGDPRIRVTDVEARLGTRYTADTLAALRAAYPGVRFTWLMGGDNLANIHRWDRWQDIFASVPIGVLARPGSTARAQLSPAAQVYRFARLPFGHEGALATVPAPAWSFASIPMMPVSSTSLRNRGIGTAPPLQGQG